MSGKLELFIKGRHNNEYNRRKRSLRQLMPVTAGYNVTVKEPLNQMDMENMIVDIYVGVCDNIL